MYSDAMRCGDYETAGRASIELCKAGFQCYKAAKISSQSVSAVAVERASVVDVSELDAQLALHRPS